jgi:hypothetical protein
MAVIAPRRAVRPCPLLQGDRRIAVTLMRRDADELDQRSHPETSHIPLVVIFDLPMHGCLTSRNALLDALLDQRGYP